MAIKPASEMTNKELAAAWNAGMAYEAQTEHWTGDNQRRLDELEAEIDRRVEAGTWHDEGCDDE